MGLLNNLYWEFGPWDIESQHGRDFELHGNSNTKLKRKIQSIESHQQFTNTQLAAIRETHTIELDDDDDSA